MYKIFQIKMFTLYIALLFLYCTCKCITFGCLFCLAFFGGMRRPPNKVNRPISNICIDINRYIQKCPYSNSRQPVAKSFSISWELKQPASNKIKGTTLCIPNPKQRNMTYISKLNVAGRYIYIFKILSF